MESRRRRSMDYGLWINREDRNRTVTQLQYGTTLSLDGDAVMARFNDRQTNWIKFIPFYAMRLRAQDVHVTDYLKTDLGLQTFCVCLQTNVSYRWFANHCHGFANKHGNSIDFWA